MEHSQILAKSDPEPPLLGQLPKQNAIVDLPNHLVDTQTKTLLMFRNSFSPEQVPASMWLSGNLAVIMGGESSISLANI